MSMVQATAVVDSDAVVDGASAADVDVLALVLSEGAVGVEFPQPMLHSATVAAITNSPVRLISIPPGCVLANAAVVRASGSKLRSARCEKTAA